jgi:hypothetical protein
MSTYPEGNEFWAFVVDTEDYAGNWERELCAFCTGHVGDCNVGEEGAKKFKEASDSEFIRVVNEIHEKIEFRTDDSGCDRPASIWPTPGWFNDGEGKHFRVGEDGKVPWPAYLSGAIYFCERPSDDLMDLIKRRAREFLNWKPDSYSSRPAKITGFRLIKVTTAVTEDSISLSA